MASQHSSPTTSEQIETNSSTTSSKRTAAVTKRRFSLTQQVIGKGSFATVFLGYEDPPVSVRYFEPRGASFLMMWYR